jgi:hypothetical protein
LTSPEAESSVLIPTPSAITFRISLDPGHGKAISVLCV